MVDIGLMTPPVGLNVYVLQGAARNISIADIFRDCGWFGWFVFVDMINAALLLAVAQISLFVPQTMIQEGSEAFLAAQAAFRKATARR